MFLSWFLRMIISVWFQVDENMSRAQKNNALNEEVFHFRKDITTQETPPQPKAQCQSAKCGSNCAPVYTAMSIDQIVNGKVTVNSLLSSYWLSISVRNKFTFVN